MSRPTTEQFLARCRAELGYSEQPGNQTKFAAMAGQTDGLAWCQTFLVAMARQTGLELPAQTAATYVMAKAFDAEGRFGSAPRAGAFVYFRFSPGDAWRWKGISHVGVVESLLADGRVLTTEGNTDVAGGSSGGRVMRKKRSLQLVAGFGYPDYADGSPDVNVLCSPTTLRALQAALHVPADGDFGPVSTRALQSRLGVAASSVLDVVTVRALQDRLQVAVDGDWGPLTTKALDAALQGTAFL